MPSKGEEIATYDDKVLEKYVDKGAPLPYSDTMAVDAEHMGLDPERQLLKLVKSRMHVWLRDVTELLMVRCATKNLFIYDTHYRIRN